jgi:GT2 family glycosyltransferase
MLVQAWSALPADLKPALLLGAENGSRLLELATRALQGLSRPQTPEARAQRLAMGRDLLFAAWEREPLNGALANQLLSLQAKAPWLAPPLLALLAAVAEKWRKPEDPRYFERLQAQADPDGLQRYLDAQLRREPKNLFWRCEALRLAVQIEDARWPELDQPSTLPQPLRALFEADALFQDRAWEAAAARYEEAGELPLARERRAEALLRAGRSPHSLAPLWRPLLASGVWRANLLLRADELFAAGAPPDSSAEQDSPIDLLLHTRDNARALDATLAALAASEGWRRLLVLDRGSTDTTSGTLRQWRERLGQDRVRVVAAPVDIGAPAALNWLLQLPETQDAALLAFVGDTVLPPPDWLQRLLQARRRYPRAESWGCRILDAVGRVLTTERAIEPDAILSRAEPDALWAEESDLRLAHGRPFRLTDEREALADFGQFDYSRPCLGTSNACRLYDSARLREGGGFNLQFAPAFLEDAERDLRRALKGGFACYQGPLAVRSSWPGARRRAKRGVELANRYKLLRLFDQAQVEELRRRQHELLEQDLLPKLARLDALFFGADKDRNAT